MSHRILFDDVEIWNQVFAGMLLFCVYARSHGVMLNMVTAGSWMRALLSLDGTNKQARFSSHS